LLVGKNREKGTIMVRKMARAVFPIASSIFLALGAHVVLAQAPQTTNAGRVEQVFASTNTATATFSNPSGAFQALDSMKINLKSDSLLVITFSARGTVAPSGGTIPIVFIRCEVDGIPCQPNHNAVEFFYPQACCDSRTFTWIAHKAAKGVHVVTILWGMGNPTAAYISNRTLVIEAATL
jgi:hypothetical protein